MTSMLGLVLAGDVVTLFVFWEGASITSFLLIGFKHKDAAARQGAFKALFIAGGDGNVLLAGKTIDTVVIAVVILVNTAIGFFQEFQAESAIEALRSRAAPLADALRCEEGDHCTNVSVESAKIVPGDIILLEAGDKIPADSRIFEATNLEIVESILMGESLTVSTTTEPLESELAVADRANLAYGGAILIEGKGKAIVYATGKNTQLGKIATLIRETWSLQACSG